MAPQKKSSFGRVSFVVHMPGHTNSKGEAAPWVIKSHETGKVLSSHKSEAEAKRHLQDMHIFGNKSVIFGSSGFGHENWLGKFYPTATLQKDRLAFYSKHFRAVEITSTRHSVPPTRVLENWAKNTPDGFVFAFCAPVSIRPSSKESGQAMKQFMDRISVVGKKLGPVALHIASDEVYSSGDAARFFDSLPHHLYAVHIESEDWLNQEVLDEMISRRVAAIDTVFGVTATDSIGWSYKRLDASVAPLVSRILAKNNTNLVFVKDPSDKFPSKELMQALRDLGINMAPDEVMTMLPMTTQFDGGAAQGKDNSSQSSGTTESSDTYYGSAVLSPEPKEENPGLDDKQKRLIVPTDAFDISNNSDGRANPFGDNVDGKTDSA